MSKDSRNGDTGDYKTHFGICNLGECRKIKLERAVGANSWRAFDSIRIFVFIWTAFEYRSFNIIFNN